LIHLAEELVLPGVEHLLQRLDVGIVEGAVCAAAAESAGQALQEVLLIPLYDAEGRDNNPFTRRVGELTPTLLLRALRPASAHFVLALLDDPQDLNLLLDSMALPQDQVTERLLSVHADAFHVSRSIQSAMAQAWSEGDPTRYAMALWGLTTRAAFGVRYLKREGAELLLECLEDYLGYFGRRLEELMAGLRPAQRLQQSQGG
jgi:hypothetical protein